MKKIAVIGCGNHVTKNILPVMEKLKWEIKYIVVRDVNKYHDLKQATALVDDISVVLTDDELDFIYIATPISTHYDYAKIALLHGRNVICEKPITIKSDEVEELNQIAKAKCCKLYQVEMYKYHNQFSSLKDVINSGKYGEVKQATFSFKIPHLAATDIRYDPKKSGGALFDVGFYPISAAIALFPASKLQYSICRSEPDYEVDLHGIALLAANDTIINCQWAIGACYENKIIIDFSTHRVVVDRAFSKPASLNTSLQVVASNGEQGLVETGCDDQFFNMFSSIESDLEKGGVIVQSTQETISIMEAIIQEYKVQEGI
ncbi:Gfo/Idh/MocA family oxidoreductase [Pseudaeromonas paramecii]|uniref:Gfo/Idh/MocA family oxidoreductase n=1 Tax=Pseudaeromonas paramecii TaxID=2138166 RepID=A0ABP8Q2V4_9GAMM